MPRRLNVVCNPVVDRLVVLSGILDVFVDFGGVVRLGWAVPGAHVDTDGQAVREDLPSGLDVDVAARRRRVGVEMGVVGGELATEGCGRA